MSKWITKKYEGNSAVSICGVSFNIQNCSADNTLVLGNGRRIKPGDDYSETAPTNMPFSQMIDAKWIDSSGVELDDQDSEQEILVLSQVIIGKEDCEC